MFAMKAGRAAVRAAPRRQLSSAFDRPNNVLKTRAELYSRNTVGAGHPTYLKNPTDKYWFAIGALGGTIGLIQVLRGNYHMSNGTNKSS